MINLPPESEEEQEDSFLSERLIDLYIKHWHRGSVGVCGGLQSIWSLDTQAYFLIQARTKRNLQTFPSLVGAGGEVKVVGVTRTSLYSSVHMKGGGGGHHGLYPDKPKACIQMNTAFRFLLFLLVSHIDR